jgi:predicted nucleic acid-binding protein
MRIYLDANFFIAAMETQGPVSDNCRALLRNGALGLVELVTSELTLAEVLVIPIRNNDAVRHAVYMDTLTKTGGLTLHAVDRYLLIRAASLRAVKRRKLPDAIHLATAERERVTDLITNDRDFESPANGAWQVRRLDQLQPLLDALT